MKLRNVLLFMTVCSSPLFADNQTVTKEGLVDMQRVLFTVDEAKAIHEKLEKDFTKKEVELQKEEEELRKLEKSLLSQLSMLSEEAKQKKGMEFQEKVAKFKQSQMQLEQEKQRARAEGTQKVAMNVVKVVDDLVKDRKDMNNVWEMNTSGALYIRHSEDLTDKVIQAYNTTFKVEKKSDKKPKKGKEKSSKNF